MTKVACVERGERDGGGWYLPGAVVVSLKPGLQVGLSITVSRSGLNKTIETRSGPFVLVVSSFSLPYYSFMDQGLSGYIITPAQRETASGNGISYRPSVNFKTQPFS